MNNLQTLKDSIPAYAKDIRLNLMNVMSVQGSPGLTEQQIYGVALASALATREQQTIAAILSDANHILDASQITAAYSAAAIMAMNNIYYRFLHLQEDIAYQQLPAKLRMQILLDPGIPKIDFECYALAISALNGCGMCIKSHVNALQQSGLNQETVQSVIRIAATINAVAQIKSMCVANNV